MKPSIQQKLVRCRCCHVLFTPEKHKSGQKYCNDSKCQQEKKNRNNRAQRKRYKKKLEDDNRLPDKIERIDKICICCNVKNVPKRKIKGVYLSVLCEDCYKLGESDILQEHRLLIDNS